MLKGVRPRYARRRSQPARGPMPGGMPRRQQCRTTRSGCGPPAPRGDGVFSGQVLSGHRHPRGSCSRDETRLRARARRQSAREEATEQQFPCRNPWHPACCRTSVDGQGDSVRCSEFGDAHPVQRPVHDLSCNVWIHSRCSHRLSPSRLTLNRVDAAAPDTVGMSDVRHALLLRARHHTADLFRAQSTSLGHGNLRMFGDALRPRNCSAAGGLTDLEFASNPVEGAEARCLCGACRAACRGRSVRASVWFRHRFSPMPCRRRRCSGAFRRRSRLS